MSTGVLYLAVGKPYFDEVLMSAESLRWVGYRGPIRVLTDQVNDPRVALNNHIQWERVEVPPGKFGSRHVKTRLYRHTPFERTLFLDTDILAYQPFERLFEVAGHRVNPSAVVDFQSTFGQRICMHKDWGAPEVAGTIKVVPEEALYFNSGVLLWCRNEQAKWLFERWHHEWNEYQQVDQLALARAQMATGSMLEPLAWKYNAPALHWATSAQEVRARGVVFAHYWSEHRKKMGDHFFALKKILGM